MLKLFQIQVETEVEHKSQKQDAYQNQIDSCVIKIKYFIKRISITYRKNYRMAGNGTPSLGINFNQDSICLMLLEDIHGKTEKMCLEHARMFIGSDQTKGLMTVCRRNSKIRAYPDIVLTFSQYISQICRRFVFQPLKIPAVFFSIFYRRLFR